ncbi:MAG: hypothetical protein AB1481_00075 [Candidatus Omnitrophota bacterium]
MEIIHSILNPAVFFSLLAGIFTLSILISFSLSSHEKKINREKEIALEEAKKKSSETEAMLHQKDNDCYEKIAYFEKIAKTKEEEYKKQISILELQLKDKQKAGAENEELKTGILKLDAQLKISDDKIHELERKIEQLNKELSVKGQMFEGLKAQYNDLEKDAERLSLQLEEERKKSEHLPIQTPAAAAPKPTPDL